MSLVITAILGGLLGMAIKDDKPGYGVPLIIAIVLHIMSAVL